MGLNERIDNIEIKANIEWFKRDMGLFLRSLHLNNLSFKYFSNSKFFNFLKKKHSIYNLINKQLYSYQANHNNCHSFQAIDPLKLTDLSKLKIKKTLAYLDVDLINRLNIPTHMNQFLSAELSFGLGKSYERTKINKIFEINTKS